MVNKANSHLIKPWSSRDGLLTLICVIIAATVLILKLWILWFYPTPEFGQTEEEELASVTETIKIFEDGSGYLPAFHAFRMSLQFWH
jgi:hypothetical protein